MIVMYVYDCCIYVNGKQMYVYVGKYVMLVNMVMCVYVIYVRCRIFVFFGLFLA